MKTIVVDYHAGNVHSLLRAIENVGCPATVSAEPRDVLDADLVVLPGVGAFGHVMEAVEPLREAILQRHEAGKPILGICIGMQILYESSQESPASQGLGILPGGSVRLDARFGCVPHMGWNETHNHAQDVYFVHSYAVPAKGQVSEIDRFDFGEAYVAECQVGRTLGIQYHPEKSGAVGLQRLRDLLQRIQVIHA